MLAHATKNATSLTLFNNGGTPVATSTVATTSYVQGAYNKLGQQINNLITDITVTGTGYAAISATNNVAENLQALDTAISNAAGNIGNTYVQKSTAAAVADITGGASDLNYLTSNGDKVGENLGILDNQVYKTVTKIGTFNDSGSKQYVSGTASVQQNIQSLDSQVATNTTDISDNKATISEMQGQTVKVVTTWGNDSTVTNMNLFPPKEPL